MNEIVTNSPFGPEDMARRRKRAIALALILAALVVLFFVTTLMSIISVLISSILRFSRPDLLRCHGIATTSFTLHGVLSLFLILIALILYSRPYSRCG